MKEQKTKINLLENDSFSRAFYEFEEALADALAEKLQEAGFADEYIDEIMSECFHNINGSSLLTVADVIKNFGIELDI